MAARPKVAKGERPVPAEFEDALKKNRAAAEGFAGLSASCRREYIEWISEAKRAETREKRIATAIEWISRGKQQNWKYQG